MTQSRLTELMTGKTLRPRRHRPRRRRCADRRRNLRPDAPRRVRGRQSDACAPARSSVSSGLIGAGRTELAHTLFGMSRADAGSIRLSGSAVAFASNREAIAAGIAYVSEDRLALGLVQPQSIADNTVITDPEGDHGRRRVDLRGEEIRGRRQGRRRVRHQDRPAGRRRVDAVGRQSATRRAREMARHVAEGPASSTARRSASTSARATGSTRSFAGSPNAASRS